MQPEKQKPKNILLIDDNDGIRFVLKKLIFKHFPVRDLGLNIYSASKGVEGLGLIYSVEANIIIIDTTLPKYSNLEILEFLLNNDRVKKLNPKILVLYYRERPEGLDEFTLIDKSDVFFYRKVLRQIELVLTPDKHHRLKFGELIMRGLGELVINFSEHSAIAHNTIVQDSSNPFLLRAFHFIKYTIDKFILNLLFILFFIVGGTKDPDTNADQKKIDLYNIRKRVFTTGSTTFALFVFVGLNLITPVFAATKTWDGGGIDNNWSTCGNWNADTCPAAGDTVVFDGTSSKDITVDPTFAGTITAINMNAAYAGTMTLARSLTVTTYTQAGGNFNGAAQTMTATTFNLSAGTFTSTSGNMNVRALNITGTPTFNANGGTLTLNSNSAQTYNCAGVTFNNVVLAPTSTGSTAIIISSNCNFPLGNNPSMGVASSITLNGTLTGTGTMTSSGVITLIANSGSSITGFSGINLRGLTVAGANLDFSSYTTFTAGSGALIISSGSLSLPAPSGTATFTSFAQSGGVFTSSSGNINLQSFNITAGTFNANSGTVTLNGSGSLTYNCNDAVFNNVVLASTNSGSTNIIINSNCNFPLGNNPSLGAAATMVLNGTISGTGTITTSSVITLTLNSGSTFSGFNGANLRGLTVAGPSLDWSAFSTFTAANGALTISSGSLALPPPSGAVSFTTLAQSGGTFTAPSTTLTLAAINLTGGTFNANGGTIAFISTGSQTLNCNSASFNNVTLSYSGGSTVATINNNCTFPMGNNPTSFGTGTLALSGTLSGGGTLTGTNLTLNTGSSLQGFTVLTLTNNLIIAGGFGDFSTYSSMTLPGSFTLSSGTFTSTAGTLRVGGNFTINNGTTYNNNGGTVNFSGGGGTISCNGANLNTVNFGGHNGAKTIAAGCNLPITDGTTIPNTLSLNGSLSGSGQLTTTGNLVFNAGSTVTGFNALNMGSLTISGGTFDASNYSPFTISDFNISSGTFTAPSGTMTIRGSLTGSGSPTFNANGGTVRFTGANVIITCNNLPFHLVDLTGINGIIRFTSTCDIPLGHNPTIVYAVNNFGILRGTGTASFNEDFNTIFNAGSSIVGFTGAYFANLNVNGANLDFSTYSPFSLGIFTISSGSFKAPPSAMSISGAFTSSGGSFDANGGSINFSGSGAITCGSVAFNAVSFAGQTSTRTVNAGCNLPLGADPVIPTSLTLSGTLSGSGTITNTVGIMTLNAGADITAFSGLTGTTNALTIAGGTIDLSTWNPVTIGGAFTITSGTFTAPTGIMSIAGNFTHTAGTFNHNNGLVNLNGGNQTKTGATTFYSLSKLVPTASNYTLTFPANTTQTILGVLSLKGFSQTNRLLLRSSSNGVQWRIDPQGTRDMLYDDIRDGNNINVATMEMGGTGSADNGNNTNFNFVSTAPNIPTTLGPANVVNGTLINDSTPTFTFNLSDPNTLDTVRFNIQVATDNTFASPILDYTSVLDVQGSRNFTVGQSAGSGTYNVGTQGQTLTSASYYWRVRATDNNGINSIYVNANGSSIAFALDIIQPEAFTPTIDPPSPTNDQTPTVTFSTTDNVEIDFYQVRIDGGGFVTRTSPYTTSTLSNGVHTITVRAYDTAGNFRDAVVMVTIDTSQPATFTPSINPPGPTNNQTPTVTFSTTDPEGIDHYEVRVDGGAFTTQTSPYVLPTLSAGVHTITVRAFDTALNFRDGSANVTIDLTPPNIFTPSLSPTSPSNDNTPTLTFSTTDSSGISGYAVSLDGGSFDLRTSPYTFPILDEGEHVVLVRAFDNAGNSRDSNLNFSIDTIAPDAFTPGINPPSPTNNPTPELTFSTTDNIAIDHYEVRVDGGGFTTQESPYVLPTLFEGAHSITVRAYDTADNFTDANIDVTVDTGSPEAFDVIFNESSPTNNQTPEVTFLTTDEDGINRYEVEVDGGGFSIQTSPYTLPTLTNGIHSVTVRAYDNAENYTESSNSIVIDITPPGAFTPNLNVTSPSKNQTPTLTFSTTDASGINHYEVRIDGGGFISRTSPYVLPSLSEGDHTFTVRAFDNAGNYAEGSRNLRTDLTIPIIVIDAPTKTSDFPITDTTVSITDDIGIDDGAISMSGGTYECTQISPTLVTCTTVISTSGNLTVTATDLAGNVDNDSSLGYAIDGTEPVIQITAPTKTSSVAITDTTIQVTDNLAIDASNVEAVGGVIDCDQTSTTVVDCTASISQSGTLSITATDDAGNEAQEDEPGYTISGSTPDAFTPLLNTGAYTNNQTPQVQFVTVDDDGIDRYEVKVDNGAFTTRTSPYTLPVLAEGVHTITVRAFDTIGNFTDGVVGVTIDITPPVSFTPFFTESSPTLETRPTIHFSTTDTFGIDHYEVRVDGGFYTIETNPHRLQILSSGPHTVDVRAVDRAGNSRVGSASISIDTEVPAPFTPILNVTSPTTNLTPQLSFSTTDSDGINRYEVKIDNGSFTTRTSPYTLPTQSEGLHTYTVRAYDNAGNYREGSTNLAVDLTSPAVFTPLLTVTSPTNDSTPNITFTTTDANGINRYEIRADNTSFITGVSPYTMPTLTEGLRTITVRAYDNAGNSRDGSVNVTIDLTLPNAFTPMLNVTSPTTNQTPTLTFSTSDDIAISHYRVQIDAGSYTTRTSPYILPTLAEGPHTINVAAYDTAGNIRVGSVAVTVDIGGPNISFNAPTKIKNSPITNTTVVVQDFTGIDDADVSAVGGSVSCAQTNEFRVDCTSVVLVSGDLVVNAEDLAGNPSSSSSTGYVIENTDPVIQITAPTKTSDNPITDTTIRVTDNYKINVSGVQAMGRSLSCVQTNLSTVDCTITISSSGDLIINAIDVAGNSRSDNEPGYTINVAPPPPDPFTPELNTGANTTETSPVITFMTSSNEGIDRYEVRIDNGPFEVQTSPYQVPTLTEGFHSITVRAYSVSGKFTDAVTNIFVDLTAPTNLVLDLNLISPTNDQQPTVTFNANDNGVISYFEVKVESCCGEFSKQTSPYKVEQALEDGEHKVTLKAVDGAGNSSEVAQTFVIDAISPNGSISINDGASATEDRIVNLSLNAFDNLSGVSEMILSEDPEFNGANFEPYAQSKEWILSEEGGEKTVYVKFKDVAKNESITYQDSIEYTLPVTSSEEEDETPIDNSPSAVIGRISEQISRASETLSEAAPEILITTSIVTVVTNIATNSQTFVSLYGFFIFYRRKKRKSWGVVYNSVTKKPIPFVTLRLYTKTGHKFVSEEITDIEGKYGFVVDKGKYQIEVLSTDYSKQEFDLSYDQSAGKFGIDIALSNVKEEREILKKLKEKLPLLNKILVISGFIFSIFAFAVLQTVLNLVMVLLYLVQFSVLIYFIRKKEKETGYVQNSSGERVKGAFVRIYDPKSINQLEVSITDEKGRYAFSLADGEYLLSADGVRYAISFDKVSEDKIFTTPAGNKLIQVKVVNKQIEDLVINLEKV